MRVLLIAASVAAALAMPVASSAQSIGLGYETDVSSVTGSAVNQGTGIVVPLPCPPTGECVNPWADQKPTVIEGFSDQFNGLYNQNLVLGDSHQGLLGEYGTFDLQGMTRPSAISSPLIAMWRTRTLAINNTGQIMIPNNTPKAIPINFGKALYLPPRGPG